jgi:A/G-specific adenine glycosylase
MQKNKTSFTKLLMQWNERENTRSMPWKGEKDPYKIWLSEVILQQTRVEQGWDYYQNFIKHYPTIKHLAKAKDEAVFKLWEGLGYYNRCKNLLFTARYVVHELKGKFPGNYASVLSLKGVGEYTAAAICSFAYNLPYAVVDGNVFRVLSRFFGIATPIDSNEGRKIFTSLANEVLDKNNAGTFNQAIMDFGATVCKPANPACHSCVMKKACNAHLRGMVNCLPKKDKCLQKKIRYFTWFVLQVEEEIFIHQRKAKDIWQNLYDFYSMETNEKLVWTLASVKEQLHNMLDAFPEKTIISKPEKQQLTHQVIKGQFVLVHLKQKPAALKHGLWVNKKALSAIAFPKLLREYIDA